ncbi:type I asparaginase [Porphyromonas miyakawae]|uniref:asparaginase n=2 Tax=Porphyromonas miyakawae TaxID=3137470 RepID=A0ABQ0E1C8_9PORP
MYMKQANNSTTPRILLIYTGGTIGMIENPETGRLQAFKFAFLEENMPELKRLSFNVDSIQFAPPVDSSNITISHWLELAEIIESRQNDYDGFVVLHGTDTMSYTSSALSFLLKGLGKPVILTGSQLPIGRLRTDGKENLLTALQIAAARDEQGKPMVPEVCIYFNTNLMRGNRTVKVSADQFDAFVSYNYPILAHAGIDICFNTKHIQHQEDSFGFTTHRALERNISLLHLFPGITEEVVRSILTAPKLRGVVLESYGSGNAPTEDWFINLLQDAIKKEIVIVNVTQCQTGSVEMNRYETGARLAEIGVASGYDMTSETAITKLMFLLAQSLTPQEVAFHMEHSICGELTRND